MTLINTELSEELYSALSFFAKKINKTESYIIAKALEKYLIKIEEHIEDCEKAIKFIRHFDSNSLAPSLEELIDKQLLE